MSRHSRNTILIVLGFAVCGTEAGAKGLGPAANAVEAWFQSAKQSFCVSPDGNDVRCTDRNKPYTTIGYASGGGAIAFVRFQADPTGNAENLEVATFRKEGGQWTFVRKVEKIFGQGPSKIGFEGEKAIFSMQVLRDGDGRCCPTGTKRHIVQVP